MKSKFERIWEILKESGLVYICSSERLARRRWRIKIKFTDSAIYSKALVVNFKQMDDNTPDCIDFANKFNEAIHEQYNEDDCAVNIYRHSHKSAAPVKLLDAVNIAMCMRHDLFVISSAVKDVAYGRVSVYSGDECMPRVKKSGATENK